MQVAQRSPLLTVVQQHVEEAASLRATRGFLVRAPHVRLHELRRHDERIAAHLDGVAVAGEAGAGLCAGALQSPGAGEVFVAAVRAIEDRHATAMARLFELAEAAPRAEAGLLSAFGWVSAVSLRGITRELLGSRSAFQQGVGLAACGMHQVDPGAPLAAAMHDADPALRQRAVRVAGELGRRDLLPACLQALDDVPSQPGPAMPPDFHAARAALLLGERDAAVAGLRTLAGLPGPRRLQAIRLLLMVLAPRDARMFLRQLSDSADAPRPLICGVGAAGDTHYVPWLIQQMAVPRLARLAAEAFSMLTGADLSAHGLESPPPAGAEAGTNDDPADDHAAMDEDEGLPWPDPGKVGAWWQSHGARFASGKRSFMGPGPDPAHCRAVLVSGCQRQRVAAAVHLRLLEPGQPLFNTAAPAWRQQRLLMSAGG